MNEIVKQGKAHRALGWGDNSEDRKNRAMRSAREGPGPNSVINTLL